jgi:hypothetical protein
LGFERAGAGFGGGAIAGANERVDDQELPFDAQLPARELTLVAAQRLQRR